VSARRKVHPETGGLDEMHGRNSSLPGKFAESQQRESAPPDDA